VLLRLPYLALSTAFSFIRLLPMSDRDKDLEILALRHQLTILQRQVDKPQLTRPDRALLAALLHRMPRVRLRQLHLIVSPDTVLRWVRRAALRCIPDAVGRNSEGGSWVAWLTWTRKREGTTACQGSGDRLEASGAVCRETRRDMAKAGLLEAQSPGVKSTTRRNDA
jgi:hypothetical protein